MKEDMTTIKIITPSQGLNFQLFCKFILKSAGQVSLQAANCSHSDAVD